MTRDMSQYEGIELLVESGGNTGEIYEGVIVGADYDIGVSIMTRDKELYLLCLCGPSSPQAKDWPKYPYAAYERALNYLERVLKDGRVLELNDYEQYVKQVKLDFDNMKSNRVSPDSCAFAA